MRNKGERQRSVVAEPGYQYKFRGGGDEGDTSQGTGGVFKAIGVQSVT